jgi:hypothetical protein
MSCYLYPNLTSKKAYKEKIERREFVYAMNNTPWGETLINSETVTFEGPHYPQPHRFYGRATVVDGRVVKVV